MVMTGNLSENWRFWKQRFQTYLLATEISKKEDITQCAQLLTLIGDEGMRIYNTFEFVEGERDKIKTLIEKFEKHFSPKKNLTYERHKFLTCKQNEYQTIEQYIIEMKNLSLSCEFGDLRESLVKDVLICGILSEKLREKLLQEDVETLADAVKICIATESVREKNKLITNGSNHRNSLSVDQLKQSGGHSKSSGAQTKHSAWGKSQNYTKTRNSQKTPCQKCSYSHLKGKCPAYGKICSNCNKTNHFSSCCKNKKRSKHVYCINDNVHVSNKLDTANNFIFLDTITIDVVGGNGATTEDSWFVRMETNGHQVRFKIDTGAMANVIPEHILRSINYDFGKIKPTQVKLNTYTNDKISVVGECRLACQLKSKRQEILFYVVKNKSCAILGLKSCLELNLIKRVDNVDIKKSDSLSVFDEFGHLFQGIGCLEKPYHIELKEDAVPVACPARSIPFAIRDDLKIALEALEKEKIIVKDTESADWVHPLVIVRKSNGQLRLCLDPKDLNLSVKRHFFKLPTLEELTEEFAGAKYFSTLDCTQGFLQVPLDRESSKLCTFSTIFGRYRFLRLPYGLTSAPEVYQERMSEIFEDIKGVKIFIDDLIISAKDKVEHDKKLREVLKRASDYNLRFNKEKCRLGLSEVKYMGYRVTSEGLKPDESKVEAIKSMPTPTNVGEIQRFLGLVTYLGRFIPNLSERTAPLRELIKKDSIFDWKLKQEKAFNDLKDSLCKSPCLKFFDPNQPVTISVDSSKSGMGAVLMQEGRPCAHASRALTDPQTRYSQIEKELLAVWFGVIHFSQYVLFSRKFTVETDHKPLVSIINKPVNSCPARLQRIIVQLRKYDFQLIYKPGKQLILADTLSRAYINKKFDENIDIEMDAQICLIEMNLNATKEKREEFLEETRTDAALISLKKQVEQGWPTKLKQVPDNIKFYFRFKHEISEANGLLYRDTKIIVPTKLRKEILSKLHCNSHLGIRKSIEKANLSFYWPGMNKEIQDMILACNICQTFQNSQTPEPMIPHDVVKLPWHKVGCDLFHLYNEKYLLLVDYYSKFFEMVNLHRDSSSENVILCLKSIFSRQGIPNCLVTDNGPEFSSYRFGEFSDNWEFKHIKSSPRYPQSNGQVERFIQTVKKTLKKAIADNKDPFLALLDLRNTPVDGIHSPANILMNRHLRDLLPKPNVKPFRNFSKQKYDKFINKSKTVQKHYYDRKCKTLKPLKKADKVWVQTQPNADWSKATIVERVGIRSYKLLLENGSSLVRNRRFIRESTSSCSENKKRTNEASKDVSTNYSNLKVVKVYGSLNDDEQFFDASEEDVSLNKNRGEDESVTTRIEQTHDDLCNFKENTVSSQLIVPSSSRSLDEPAGNVDRNSLSNVRSTRSRVGREIRKPSRYTEYLLDSDDIDSIN